jgi:hypothetical protein
MNDNNINKVFESNLTNCQRELFFRLLKKAAKSINNEADAMTPKDHMALIIMCSNMFLPRTEHEEVLHKLCDKYVETGVFKMPKKTRFAIKCICDH